MKIDLKLNKHDFIIFIATITLIVVLSVLYFMGSSSNDNVVIIRYYNEVVHKMNLQVDETFTMKVEDYPLLLGDLTIEVKNGKVGVVEQTSHYNYCELVGSTDKKGTAIICAPNGVVITIEGYQEPCDFGYCEMEGDE